MRLSGIITQLTNNCPTATSVELAYSVNGALDADLPILYVSPVTEVADESVADNFVAQTVTETFSVLISADAVGDALDTMRDEVFAALLGFQVDANHDAVEFSSGDLVDINQSVIWWRDNFEMRHYRRQS